MLNLHMNALFNCTLVGFSLINSITVNSSNKESDIADSKLSDPSFVDNLIKNGQIELYFVDYSFPKFIEDFFYLFLFWK